MGSFNNKNKNNNLYFSGGQLATEGLLFLFNFFPLDTGSILGSLFGL